MASIAFPLLQAAQSTTGSLLTTFIPFGLVILIFYFLIIRPQNKKQKETQRMLSELKKGDRVVTIGGLHGVINSVKESTVVVKVDENCKLEFSRSAIASVVVENAKADKKDDKKSEKKAEAEKAVETLPASDAGESKK
jgi:preprotein translocase subunit YajC